MLMLQVDFFWTWAIGAHLAVAAARQLKDIPEENRFINKYFLSLVLFMALLFGATGMVLFMVNPLWETMQVWTHNTVPLALVIAWFVTNVTNAIFAYAICWYFIRKGDELKAHLQWVIGYFLFFFVLVYGWDGTGILRFSWDATVAGPWAGGTMGLAWLGSPIAITLYILGVIFLPPYLYLTSKWAVEGMREDPDVKEKIPEKGIKTHLLVAFYGMLGVMMTLLLVLASAGLGWTFNSLWGEPISAGLLGIAIVGVASYFLLFRKGMLFEKFLDKFRNP